MRSERRQAGMTLISWIILILLVGFVALFGFRLFPIYLEYYAVNGALKSVTKDIQQGETPAQIYVTIDNLFNVNSINDIKSTDVKISTPQDSNSITLTLDYDSRTNFIGNIDLLVHFHIVKKATAH